MKGSVLRTAIVANMEERTPTTTDARYLHHYGYALRQVAQMCDNNGHPFLANAYRERAYTLRTRVR